MSNFDYVDFSLGYQGHPRFVKPQIIEDDLVRVIIQKYEVIIFTNKGDVLAEPELGGNLSILLNETRLSAKYIENNIRGQIDKYIEEIANLDYQLKVEIFEDPERHQEYMIIGFIIKGYEVYARVI